LTLSPLAQAVKVRKGFGIGHRDPKLMADESERKAGSTRGGEMMLQPGEKMAEFELDAHDGTTVRSSELSGTPYLLFFYPKAATPG
jgi:hypothetical protein